MQQQESGPQTAQQHPAIRPYPMIHPPHNIGHIQSNANAFSSSPGLSPGATGQEERAPKEFRMIPDPPDLDEWRQRLFAVNETITLSEEDYYTYFPHVDNVYSHRSTQKYKRKPFVSHYWDCRLKGRPPGTPKSEDPNKKKRKRTARERDLCDVKIKITEYFEGAMLRAGFVEDRANAEDGSHIGGQEQDGHNPNAQSNNYYVPPQPGYNPNSHQPPTPHPGALGARYFTIQRVNGNGGNGKGVGSAGGGVAGPHKHTLAESDKVKKNSVTRLFLKQAKELKRGGAASHEAMHGSIGVGGVRGVRAQKPKASGEALKTVRKHAKAVKGTEEGNEGEGAGVVFYGDCEDAYSQRVWIALEALQIPYQYVEVELNGVKPGKLLEVSSRGEVPTTRKGKWGVSDSRSVLEYLCEVAKELAGPTTSQTSVQGREAAQAAASREKRSMGEAPVTNGAATGLTQPTLLADTPQERATQRQWLSYIDHCIVPAYNDYLAHSHPVHPQPHHPSHSPRPQGGPHQEPPIIYDVPPPIFTALQHAIITIVAASHPTGPFFSGEKLGIVDVALAPWVLRFETELWKMGWRGPEEGSRWESWVLAVKRCAAVLATLGATALASLESGGS